MLASLSSKPGLFSAICLIAIVLCFQPASAQSDDENDPVKLFEKGQDAHAKSDYKLAIELYDAAIKLKPEFPEAEFQRAMALLTTNRKPEAIEGFKRAVALRPEWALAYTKFGTMLAASGDSDRDAEPILREALRLGNTSVEVTAGLASVRQRAGDYKEALSLIRAATALKDATAATWQRRAYIESGAGDSAAALSSISHALVIEPQNLSMLVDRARLFLGMKDSSSALADLDAVRTALTPATAKRLPGAVQAVASLYGRAGKPEAGLKLIDALDEKTRQEPAFVELRADLAAAAGQTGPEDLAALEQVVQRDPKNASLLARLGGAYRRVDAAKSQDYYYRALQLEPKNSKYAVGYASALIQGRKFAEAEPILRRVIVATPDDYTAHANLALALYEMKRFAEAVPEYEWLAAAKPEIAATYFFIATAHDNLGEYQKALDAYESFVSHADPVNNKLEIDKVNLRLPTLRAQIQRGEGAKQKRP
jgi:tetratricopeptide (TPR) repeat protein